MNEVDTYISNSELNNANILTIRLIFSENSVSEL